MKIKSLFYGIASLIISTASAQDKQKMVQPYDYEYIQVHPEEKKLTEKNDQTLKLILKTIGEGDFAKLRTLYADDEYYVQHSGYMADKFEGVLELFKNVNPKELVYKSYLFVSEGPYVVVLNEFKTAKDKPTMVAIDLNFIRNGKSYGHWDILEVAGKNEGGLTPFEGIPALKKTTAKEQQKNKDTVAKMLNEVYNLKQFQKVNQYFSEDFQSYASGAADRSGLEKELKNKYFDAYVDIQRLISSGNMVFAHSRVVIEGKAYLQASFYLMENGKIVKSWGSQQRVIQEVRNPNGSY